MKRQMSKGFIDGRERGRRMRWLGRLHVPETGSTVVIRLFQIINQQRVTLGDLERTSGVRSGTISDWRCTRSPSLQNIQAVLNALGYELRIAKLPADTRLQAAE